MQASLHLVGWIAPLVVVGVAVPLALGAVGPNQIYGFRTGKTLSSPEIWYLANRFAGIALAIAGMFTVLVNLAIWRAVRSVQRTLMYMTISLTVPVLGAVAASLVYLRSL
jgi:uncharacterized membrane protein